MSVAHVLNYVVFPRFALENSQRRHVSAHTHQKGTCVYKSSI